MKQSLIFFLMLACTVTCYAQDGEAAARACLEHYMSGEPGRMEQAFHPSATMKYIDYKTGEFKDVPIAEFLERVKTNYNNNKGVKPNRTIEIVSLNMEGTAAQAKIRIETDKVVMYDYMNLLKLDNGWKIVSKIFSRQDK